MTAANDREWSVYTKDGKYVISFTVKAKAVEWAKAIGGKVIRTY